MAWEIHFPDEVNPEITFTPNRAPVIVGEPTRRTRNRNMIVDEMWDGRTLVQTKHGPSIVEYAMAFVSMPSAKVLELDAFMDAVEGRAFRMVDFLTGEWITVKQVNNEQEDTFTRTSDGDSWNVGMRVRRVN